MSFFATEVTFEGKFGKYSEKFKCSIAEEPDHALLYLFFWDFQGFQVIAYDTEFLFKFNNFTAKIRKVSIKNK